MLRAIRQHFADSTKILIRKSALMTEKAARKHIYFTVLAPFFIALIVSIEINTPSQTVIMKCLVWWLIGIMVLGAILFSIILYGYYNRHRIDTSGEKPLN